jgi:3-oxoacyl-[acyl-carrier protein] reductase
MGDFLVEMGQNQQLRKLVKSLGLPIPIPEKLRRAGGAWEERPLGDETVVVSSGPGGALAPVIAETLAAAGASTHLAGDDPGPYRAAGEAYGRPVKKVLIAEEGLELRADALLFDATGVDAPSGLRALYDFFHPLVAKLVKCGRVVVLARPTAGLTVEAATAQAAIEGFVRSLGKEVGRSGSTANLIYVEHGAGDRLPAVLTFLLSRHASFVSGQALTVTAKAAATGPATIAPRSLEGKVALVTGAARGIGEATARLLAGEGAKVVCLDRPADDALASQLAREVGGAVLCADVSDPDAPRRIAEELERRFGGVDIVVHNAGVTRDKTLARMAPEQWDEALDINLSAVLRLTGALLPRVLRDGGRIVCLSSVAGIAGNVGQTNYAASKAGILGFVRAQAAALAKRGITVNAVAPGFIETRLTAAIPFAIREAARRMSSLGQGGLPRDVAEVIGFLAMPGASGLTGGVVRVCGQSLVGA